MEIELTSSRDDGTWTWRAAGAREPRGIIDGKVLSAGVHVGDVVRVEAEFELEGISILAVLQQRERSKDPDRIELAPRLNVEGSVTTSLVSKSERRPRDRSSRDRSSGSSPDRSRRTDRTSSPRTPPGTRRAPSPANRTPRAAPSSIDGAREVRKRVPRVAPASSIVERPERKSSPAHESHRPRPHRFVPGTKHRDLLLATLLPEQRPIAEQLAIGGLPAVRRALAEQRSNTDAGGQPHVAGDAIVALAEELLPAVREATWLDRAEAAKASLEALSLRDLRATVSSAAPRDAAGRELLASLRTALEARLSKLRTTWEKDIVHAIDEGRVLQALRLSARPPEPSTRFPGTLVQRLADAAGAALNVEAPPERWLELLDAAATSPIRRSIKPSAIPTDPSGELHKAATVLAGRIPSLARLLGLAMPPPPRPVSLLARRANRPGVAAPNHLSVATPKDATHKEEPSEETNPPEKGLGAIDALPEIVEALVSQDAVIDEPLLEAVDEV
jgi:hypothetical protein